MSQIERCQSKHLKWCNVNGFKGINWSQDQIDDISVREIHYMDAYDFSFVKS